jgi:hypothetical protein
MGIDGKRGGMIFSTLPDLLSVPEAKGQNRIRGDRGRIGIAVARVGVEHTPGHINGGRGPDPGARGSEELNAELVPPHRFWYLGDAEALPQHLAGGGVQGSDAAAKAAAWVVRISTLRETPTNRICPPWRPHRCRESREILQS